ncbi:MAG: hypothetical protein ACOY93_02545 [Bacillota bacterium]
MVSLVLGVIGWLISVVATSWYLRTFYQLHQEMQTIRRYLQAIHERMEKG